MGQAPCEACPISAFHSSQVKKPRTYVRGFNPMQASLVLSLLFPGTARTYLSIFHPSPNLIILKEDLGTISIPGLTSAEFKQVVLNRKQLMRQKQHTLYGNIIRTGRLT